MAKLIPGALLATLFFSCNGWSDESPDARQYLATCLDLATVQQVTDTRPEAASRIDRPQPGCSYNDSEVIARQTRILYQRDPAYSIPFNIEGLMQPVSGLGRFAEYEADAARLYVNVGPDGIVFEGRIGKTPLSLEQLSALAQAVLAAGSQ